MQIDFFEAQMKFLAEENSFDEFVLPDYSGFNVKNVSSIVGRALSVASLENASIPTDYVEDLDGVEKIILLILDGFGYKRLMDHMSVHNGIFTEMAQRGVLKPITTVFPSTTSTVLTSIFTGLAPAEHNIIGYQMFSKDYGLVYNTLGMNPVYGYSRQVNIADEYAKRISPWTDKLIENDVTPFTATKSSIAGDGLSQIIHRNQVLLPYRLTSDMLSLSAKILENQESAFLFTYYSGIDNLAHKYGPYSQEVDFEISSLECSLKNFCGSLSEKTKKQTMMLIIADHGIAETNKVYYLKDHQSINDRLILPPVGDSRATFLFSKPNEESALEEAFRKDVEGIRLYPSADLVGRGVFGNVEDPKAFRFSVGDFTALSAKKSILQYPYFEDDRLREQMGAHGGMTAEEMIVPLLSIRLAKM